MWGSVWGLTLLVLLLIRGPCALADPTPFDLVGPQLTVAVTRAGKSLPISQTPNLAQGDQLFIKADLPPSQSVHYLLVAAFLRGATNPPPDNWFYRAETWNHKGRDGLKIVAPVGAQQVLVFLAPESGGGFKAIIDAVRRRPGAFVRASQDLNQASLDRSRLDAFLAAIHRSNLVDQDHLQQMSPLLARSLAIKLNADCLKKIPELQAACLTEGDGALVLTDGQSASMVQQLTSGQSADLIAQLSNTPKAGAGYYSPYVGAVMDIARIVDSFQTAQYQYLPALVTTHGDQLSMVLNTPPSFKSPMSVLMTSLPPIEPPQTPPLRAVDPKQAYCAEKPGLVLPVEGAPLAFSTGYAHDVKLHLTERDGQAIDLPAQADAEKGGFTVNTAGLDPAILGESVEAAITGYWGFEPFEGPRFRLQIAGPTRWTLAPDEQQSLIVGRDDVAHLASPRAMCVESIQLRLPSGETQKVEWKAAQPDELTLTLPLKDAQAGAATLLIKQFGVKTADEIPLQTFTHARRIDGFTYHVGDPTGVLKGARLDDVTSLTLRGVVFKPAGLKTVNGDDDLSLSATDAESLAKLKAGDTGTAIIAFSDGRTKSLRVTIDPIRPSITLISKSLQPGPVQGGPNLIQLTDSAEVERGAVLAFSIRAERPPTFSANIRIEVAGATDAVLTTLTLTHGLVLEDPGVAVATLNTGEAFSPSTSGPLRFRLVDENGASDWQPLAMLVRLPQLRDLKCPPSRSAPCQLSGANLFLIDAISADRSFGHPIEIPEGFTGFTVQTPHAAGRRLFIKLHDAPTVINQVTFPAEDAKPAAEKARATS